MQNFNKESALNRVRKLTDKSAISSITDYCYLINPGVHQLIFHGLKINFQNNLKVILDCVYTLT